MASSAECARAAAAAAVPTSKLVDKVDGAVGPEGVLITVSFYSLFSCRAHFMMHNSFRIHTVNSDYDSVLQRRCTCTGG